MACAFQVSRQHLDAKGIPYDGGLLYCYMQGTTELYNTYSDSYYGTINPNPIVLDSRGNCKVYWDGSPMRIELFYEGKLVEYWDNVTGTEIPPELTAHLNDHNNPHQVTAAQVGAYTTSQANNLFADKATATTKYGILDSHVNNTNNPHQVTASQVGAYTREETDIRIAEASSSAGIFLGNLAPATLNEMIRVGSTHLNDHAVMSQPGILYWEVEGAGHTLDVAQYDHVICTSNGWTTIGQPKWGLNVSGTTFTVAPF